jgi:hypothetical protein
VSSSRYPVPPHVRFRVGITGHRGPPKLPVASEVPVCAVLDRIFSIVVEQGRAAENAYLACAAARDGFTAGGAKDTTAKGVDFVVVSSLAEGADRLVAKAGLKAGFSLEAVLPFSRAEYRRDFETQESCTAYEELLNRAASVFELDGTRDESPRAYESAGFIMLHNADLLIAIWDGNLAAGVGGTAEIISRAVADGIPIIWIEPTNPNAMRLSWSVTGEVPDADAYARPTETFRKADEADLAAAIREILALPVESEAETSLKQYLQTKQRRWNFCPWYPLLSWLFAARPLRRSDFCLPPAVLDTKERWRDYLTALPRDRRQRPAIENVLLPACAVADHLATYYALVYRSTYIFNFLFAAIAVTVALCGIFIHEPAIKSYLVLAELAVITAILVTWLHGHRRQWHRRWLECRRLAECMRHLRIFAPLGTAGSIERPRRNLDVDKADWINWYAWSLRRLLPLPDRAVDREYLRKLREILRDVEIDDQISYHKANAKRMAKLDHRLHLCGQLLFGATAALCVGFIGMAWSGALDGLTQSARDLLLSSLTFLTALLPTLGAALAAIHAQGEFHVLADQSRRTAERLMAIDKILAEEQLTFALLVDRAEKTSDVMMSDLLEWHTVFRTRPLALPA